MSEPCDRPEAPDDGARPSVEAPSDSAPANDSPQLGQVLLEHSIDQLERLRRDYGQVRTLLEELWQQLSEREVQVSQRLRDAMSLMTRILGQSPGNPESAGNPTSGFVLRIQALGKFTVRHRGQPLSLGSSRRGRAVFRYLVTRPERRAAKDVLLELFWPGESPEKANHKLHIAISTLRQTLHEAIAAVEGEEEAPTGDASTSRERLLQEGCILFQDDHYVLNPVIHVELDADQFAARYEAGERLEREERTAEARAEYAAAAALYHGDFLTEDTYADWAIGPRARLEEMYLTLLGHLADDYLSQGRFTECISCCRQILARDSFREDAYRHLMRCYSRMGRRNKALREYAGCVQILRQELGVQPMRETQELCERIKREEAV